jgi:hypothetical protein
LWLLLLLIGLLTLLLLSRLLALMLLLLLRLELVADTAFLAADTHHFKRSHLCGQLLTTFGDLLRQDGIARPASSLCFTTQ